MGEKKVTAPYNFVPFAKMVLKHNDDLPEHNKIYSDLKTGEIHIKITAETPIFISDGNKTEETLHFYKNGNNKYAVPGGSLRGLIRENMQILGFGQFDKNENFEDYQIFYRSVAAKRNGDDAELLDYYRNLLRVESKSKNFGNKKNATITIPHDVRSGYMVMEHGKYVIYPTKDPFIRISRKNSEIEKFNKAEAYEEVTEILYKGNSNDNIIINHYEKNKVKDMEKGVLIYTGKPVNGNNPVYLFPEIDLTAAPVYVSDEDVESYIIDYENRKNELGTNQFWNLFENKNEEPKPVFYVQKEGHVYFGRTLFLRVGYKYPLSRGLFKVHTGEKILDYVHAMMGFTDFDGSGKYKSYKSRISCEDCIAIGDVYEEKPVKVTLSNPKASYYKNYVIDGKHYNCDDFKLRGYKQYWFKENVDKEVPEQKKNVVTSIAALSKGTKFSGIIRFKNLNEIELGLLLWCIKLNGEQFHGLGMAKPYGYGRVKIEIDEMRLIDADKIYNIEHLFDNSYYCTVDPKDQDNYINKYKKYASENLLDSNGKKKKIKIDEYESIKALMFMKKTIIKNEECRYMQLDDYKNASKLKSLNEYMEEYEKSDNEITTESNMDERLSALMNKYKKH